MNCEIGTDILNIKRLENILKKYPHFINKYYTKEEIKIASSLKNPLSFYAARFAAKEAIFKALKGKFDFSEIEILKNMDGSPNPKILNHNDIKIKLSLSYEEDYAIAYCFVLF